VSQRRLPSAQLSLLCSRDRLLTLLYQPVFDPEMQLFFAGITKVDKWKWELDVAANKAGGRYSPNPEPTKDGKADTSFDAQPDFFADGMDGQMQQDNVSL
jgi:hypothetical protein